MWQERERGDRPAHSHVSGVARSHLLAEPRSVTWNAFCIVPRDREAPSIRK